MKAQDYKLNQEKMVVTFVPTLEIFASQVDYLTFYAIHFAIQHLSWSGQYKSILTGDEWQQAYLMCDGFGPINLETAKEQCFDWSHVRDSQNETLVKVADWIASKKWHLGSIKAIADNMVEQCKRAGIDPILVVPGMES